jgi:hypothetical protein
VPGSPPSGICETYHVVQPGEELREIAVNYRVGVNYLAKVNGITEPDYLIRPRMRLCIPLVDENPYAPWLKVREVVQDNYVTVKGFNFPSYTSVEVYINYVGSKGLYGTNVGTAYTNIDGKLKITIDIPDDHKGPGKLDIRLQTADGSIYTYKTFRNIDSDTVIGYKDLPSLSITSVVPDWSVTITSQNFPAYQVYDVYMGLHKNPWTGGYYAGSISTGEGGTLPFTLIIPAELRGNSQMVIRLETISSKYAINKWFDNYAMP